MRDDDYEDPDRDETPPDTDEDCGCEGDEEGGARARERFSGRNSTRFRSGKQS